LGSGGWKLSALFKLQCIGIEADHIPAAFADDALSREEIVNTAIRRAITMKAGTGFQSVTYVGDGLWDAKTCRNLGIPFVGIACGPKAERLRDEGASSVLADFRDASALEQALAKARIPGQAPDPACSQRKVKP
jgi:phosphoglycolate phosphatase-like HAD superfamily hydrolase